MTASTTSETSPHRICPNEAEPDKIRKVCNRRGLKVNHLWYWSEELRMPHLNGKSIQIRVDAWDVRFVLALVNGEWIRCWSSLAWLAHNLTGVELR